jgi:tRNA nucleotidyltransferase/poly(A) polymerase
MIDPSKQRQFALDVVRKLRGAGFEAYWAGGCVRDEVLGRQPKDYDVATNAKPPEIRELFGKTRTLPLGAAFGVITVVGPRPAGQIEVATFRQDAEYSDGRHPDSVTFTSAREDAERRDFTINGMFYDPVESKVIDYVGGQEDLRQGRIRAIGAPRLRFGEDKLRMLRAVRFAAVFSFAIDDETSTAIREMASQITVVSPERIAMEMRRVLTEPGRVQGVRLLIELRLAEAVLPQIAPQDESARGRLERSLDVLSRLREPEFPLALAALLAEHGPAAAIEVGLRWKLSNKETDEAAWLAGHHRALAGAPAAKWSKVQPLLAHDWATALVDLHEASSSCSSVETAWCRERLTWPGEKLNPPPLATGNDLMSAGLRPGPAFAHILQAIRDAQLDGEIQTKEQALTMAIKLSKQDL